MAELFRLRKKSLLDEPSSSSIQSANAPSSTLSPETRAAINDNIIKALTTPENPAARAEALLADRMNNRPLARSRAEYDRQVKKLREETFAEVGATDPLKRSSRPGSYTDADLKRTGANQMGYDWSKTDDPLRGSRLGDKATTAATPQQPPENKTGSLENLKNSRSQNLKGLVSQRLNAPQSPPANKQGAVISGEFGTAVSGPKSITSQLTEQGAVAKGFQLTPEQRVGESPLPKEFAEGRANLLEEAKKRDDLKRKLVAKGS